jgi:hypothetical protein
MKKTTKAVLIKLKILTNNFLIFLTKLIFFIINIIFNIVFIILLYFLALFLCIFILKTYKQFSKVFNICNKIAKQKINKIIIFN